MEMKFKRVHTNKDITISTVVLLAGIGLFFINKWLGIFVAACGLLLFLIYKGGYKKDGKGVMLLKKSEDLCKVCKISFVEYLSGKNVPLIVKRGSEGGSVRIDLYYNREERIAYAQFFEFSNYSYEPLTEIVELNGERAETIIASIM